MKNIIVREYLESLTERDELDYIFPFLLEAMDFKIIAKADGTKGISQYGKDVIAQGIDINDKIEKRFYFQIKGGSDKDITTENFLRKRDGIIESIREAKFVPYNSSNPEFEDLPIKIILVHNGELKDNAREAFDGFIKDEFKDNLENSILTKTSKQFERWGLSELTKLFSKFLFDEYLLIDNESVTLFKKVLVLINTPRNDYSDFYLLINSIFKKVPSLRELPIRKRTLFFQTLNLIVFIVYSFSKDSKNLEPAKKCIPYASLKLWSAILESNLEDDKEIIHQYRNHFKTFLQLIDELYKKTLPIASLKNGLWNSNGGRYEQIGYPKRALDYLSYLLFYYECLQSSLIDNSMVTKDEQLNYLKSILNNNDATSRPLLDIHSIPICLTLNYLIENNCIDDAKAYLSNTLHSIQLGYNVHKRLPDANNKFENVIRYVITGKKSVHYADKTSLLLGMLSEYLAKLDMEEEYYILKEFVEKVQVDLAVFVPYSNEQIKNFLSGETKSHELPLLTKELYNEGYQSEISLDDDFETFKVKTQSKNEFNYNYTTSKVGLRPLITLAHIFYKTPLPPHYWR